MDATTFNIGICEMSADLFVLSVKRGYDSKDFIEKLMKSETATHLYNKTDTQMWLGSNYIMETLEQEVQIKKGEIYPEDLMSWIGYLFACWNFTYADDTPKDMIKQAPVEVLILAYQGLHVLSFEDAIRELKNIYKEKRKK
ncbi:MAG TPA: hypothetical protein H9742_09140 [Candidatus Acetatifactor stercoripullorum]|uniref:Uncharacterized protein n=1 Tax=Candidatus Acetatifactor stercoripullorum TaxID=2838414 RepID=A0A9D1UCK8_9FIRM|nr:hypothetical protein [Candidatus Acetatifactor stercoripullorum]HIW81661.1 hypothetical protein [Candidatus Acetatifactor stercoripullorum]